MRNHLAICSYLRTASIIVHAEDLPMSIRARARGDQECTLTGMLMHPWNPGAIKPPEFLAALLQSQP
jgi:hypothetical protein